MEDRSLSLGTRALILASKSPRRQELLRLLGVPFEVVNSQVEEELPDQSHASEQALYLARRKAYRGVACYARTQIYRPAIVLAADTLVVLGDHLLGKPQDEAQAVAMLTALRGRWHRVCTGLALLDTATGQEQTAAVWSDVLMRCYSDAEIAAYVATGDPLDKAAAYGIQHPTFHPAAAWKGCYANVMGLPLCALYDLLINMGLKPANHPALTCPLYLGITCPHAAID